MDECIPRPLISKLAGHAVTTVQLQGWAGIANGALLKRIATSSFDAFVTMDKSLPAQQLLTGLPFGIILLRATSNKLQVLAPLAPQILVALAALKPGDTVSSRPKRTRQLDKRRVRP